MLNRIIQRLNARAEIQAWTVRHIESSETQLYAVPAGVEAVREVSRERYEIKVLRHTPGPDGRPACGAGAATLLPNDDVDAALDEAILMAGLVHNPLYGVPAPAAMPDVPLIDADYQRDPAGTLERLYTALRDAAGRHGGVRVTAAEFYGETSATHLINSRGVDVAQIGTQLATEFVLAARHGRGDQARDAEALVEMYRRRAADFDLLRVADRRAQHALDTLDATAPPDYEGAVILRDEALGEFFRGSRVQAGANVFQTLSSAAARFNGITSWQVGKPILPGEVKGDALTMWANRCQPYGVESNRFDEEGLPAQRILLIDQNRLAAFTASQRYAEYLALPPTGAFGNFEVAAGRASADRLLSEPHVEIAAFSFFNPNPISGDFACEIRLGYVFDGGRRVPFKGGMLVGNSLTALADVQFSAETGAYGDYFGPTTARFGSLRVTGLS